MDTFEVVGYTALGILLVGGFALMALGILLSGPGMIVGLIVLVGFGALMIKVLKERLANEEDDYYSNTVEK